MTFVAVMGPDSPVPATRTPDVDIVREYAAGLPVGRFLDLGCSVGDSPTSCLVDAGWEGVCVDAGWKNVGAWLDKYRDNTRMTLVRAAITSHDRAIVRWYDCRDSALSTCDTELFRRGCGRETAHTRQYVASMQVNDLVECFGVFSVVCIDLEGLSIPVMGACNWTEVQVACIEYYHAGVKGPDESVEIMRFMSGWGFTDFVRTDDNVICRRPK
jgi:hypothetical protein